MEGCSKLLLVICWCRNWPDDWELQNIAERCAPPEHLGQPAADAAARQCSTLDAYRSLPPTSLYQSQSLRTSSPHLYTLHTYTFSVSFLPIIHLWSENPRFNLTPAYFHKQSHIKVVPAGHVTRMINIWSEVNMRSFLKLQALLKEHSDAMTTRVSCRVTFTCVRAILLIEIGFSAM